MTRLGRNYRTGYAVYETDASLSLRTMVIEWRGKFARILRSKFTDPLLDRASGGEVEFSRNELAFQRETG